ncbi:small, acid-soluble spore protein, H family [Phosphitispora fastidiosa]|uniref:small, acid-soluble spore protein, H family n=1 Tax=Phosphitispora fastidiosa TaxID=2837202 RepID=UPI00338E3EE4|nr:H-type small acid-soluble spore protein [Phosphitispora fastidiosa]
MEYNKIKEMLYSQNYHLLFYNNEPVWLRTIDENSQTAVVSSSVFSEPDKTVFLNQLNECCDC